MLIRDLRSAAVRWLGVQLPGRQNDLMAAGGPLMSGIVLGGARASSDVFERVGSPIRAKTSDEGWVPHGGRMGRDLRSGRRRLTRRGRRTESNGWSALRTARLDRQARSRYSPSFALMASSDAGRDSLLRGCPPQRGTAVFENSTACASTIIRDRGVRPGSTRQRERLGVHGGGTKSQVDW
jgi:hypothetical protein